jgi:hypothetical protein
MNIPWRKLRSKSPLPTVHGRDPFQYRLFAELFAAFLRQRTARWRLRRSDYFSPLDLNLAARRIRLDLRIDRPLLKEFLNLYGESLRIPPGAGDDAREVTAFVPVLSHPKRLLLRAQQRLNGEPLPGLQRYDESRILARDLLALLYAGQTSISDSSLRTDVQDPRRTSRLRLIVSALLFSDPHRLKERLEKWCEKDPTRRLYFNFGLGDEKTLSAWIKAEGNEFLPGLGDELEKSLASFVQDHIGGGHRSSRDFEIDLLHRPGGLAYFPTFELLLLHAVQDLAKMLIETESPRLRGQATVSPRAALVANVPDIAKRMLAALHETETLVKLLRTQASDEAYLDFIRHLDRWVSYAVVTFRPSVPFSITFEDVFPLDKPGGKPLTWWERKRRTLWKTVHHYPLPLKDALSVHVEVVSTETELVAAHCDSIALKPDGSVEKVETVFGQKFEPNERLLHRYSSKRPAEGVEVAAERGMADRIWLEVRWKLLANVKAGYWSAAATFAVAAVFVAVVAVWSVYDSRTNSLIDDTVVVGTLATGLALWLITTQYRSSVVHRKLWIARWAMYISIIAMVASLATLGVIRFVNAAHAHRTCTKQSTQACSHASTGSGRGR